MKPSNKTIFQEDTTMKNTEIKDLNLDQLEIVSGGVLGDIIYDSYTLYDAGLIDEKVALSDAVFHWESYSLKVQEAWKKISITCVAYAFSDNEYYYNGNKITQDEARKIAKNYNIKGPIIGTPVF